jgi:hypothetical protein
VRDPILILVDIGLAPQTKAVLDPIVGLIVSERLYADGTLVELFENGVRELLVSKRLFIRSVLRVALALLGEHKSLWLGLLDRINRQRIA